MHCNSIAPKNGTNRTIADASNKLTGLKQLFSECPPFHTNLSGKPAPMSQVLHIMFNSRSIVTDVNISGSRITPIIIIIIIIKKKILSDSNVSYSLSEGEKVLSDCKMKIDPER